jgi:alpha-galactosidase
VFPAVPTGVYDARINGREILTPKPPAAPRLTGAPIFGVRPGKPIRFHLTATGDGAIQYSATGLPLGVTINPSTGWILGPAPKQAGDVVVVLKARNIAGSSVREFTLRVSDTICLTPPMGWNSWYVQSEGVSDKAIRETSAAMEEKGLTNHGWTYVNIDDCWTGLRDPTTKAIQPNAKFGDMKSLVDFVNSKGLKLGIYSTPWMSTYGGYIGGSAPNKQCDYSEFFLPENKRQNPQQLFGRYPNSIAKGLATIGPVWLVDRDARQFAQWGIDYVKYDWTEWTLEKGNKGYAPAKDKPQEKTEAVVKHLSDDFHSLDRDIVVSLSPGHNALEDAFVPKYCNLWRLTRDIWAVWPRMTAPFHMEKRLQLTGPGHYGDLDMLQIGPLGKANRSEVVFKPSPLTPAEQYHQVTLWCILTQPLLLSCNIPTMDAFDLNLVTNDEVLAVDQDPLCKQGERMANQDGNWEIWAKDLADGSKVVAMFNLSSADQVLTVTKSGFYNLRQGVVGTIRQDGFDARAGLRRVGGINDDNPIAVSKERYALFDFFAPLRLDRGRGEHSRRQGSYGPQFAEGCMFHISR